AGAPRRQARPHLQDAAREVQRDPRRGGAATQARTAGPGGHRQRRRVGDPLAHAEAARLPSRGAERQVSRAGGRDRGAGGTAGRQGDPGGSVFFLSLEDDLMRLFGSDRIARWMDRTGAEENEVITHPWVTGAIGQAQKRVELQNFQARKKLLEYDDVMNQQREVVYSLRLFALEGGEELKAEALRMVEQAVAELADELIGDTKDAYRWDRALMETEFLLKFLVSVPGVTDPARI